jgi:microcystin-dependent protein
VVFRDKARDGTTRLTGGTLSLEDIMDAVHPVGSYYTSDDPTDPGTLFGGTWARIKGLVVVGVDEADTSFDVVGETGGEKEHILSVAEMPSHNHGGATDAGGVHAHNIQRTVASGGSAGAGLDFTSGRYVIAAGFVENSTSHGHGINSQGGGGAHNNLQPYITAYMWKRTA